MSDNRETRGRSGGDVLQVTSSNSGVCDPLADATPGLEYLCIAFCELQDCQLDYSLDNPFQNCSKSSERLLARYEARRGAGDPDMPCLQQPQSAAARPRRPWLRGSRTAGPRQLP